MSKKADLYKYHKDPRYNPSRKMDDENINGNIFGSYYDHLIITKSYVLNAKYFKESDIDEKADVLTTSL